MNALQTYRSRRVETASPLQVLVMLYQELLRRIELGAICLDEGDRRDATLHFQRAREVVAELNASLDPRGSGGAQLCADLGSVYTWSLAELVAAGRDGDALRARKVGRAIEPLLEGFHAVMMQGGAT